MMVIIVYSSKSGSTRRYAESLALQIGCSCYSVKRLPESDDSIVYLGWLRGPFVVGLPKIDRKRLVAIGIVSLESNPSFGWSKVASVNDIKVPVYHLRGWIDRMKINPLYKLIMYLICARMKLMGLSSTNQSIFDAMINGGSFYDEADLEPMVFFCRNK